MAQSQPQDLTGKRLLLIKPSSLGDVCHAAATAWALKERWPGLHLTWLVNTTFEPLVKPLSCVDATLPFERSRFKGLFGPVTRRGEFKSFVGSLRAGRFDVVLDLQGLFRSGLFGWLSRAALRVGQRGARECAGVFYNCSVEVPPNPVHARERYAALAAALGCATPQREDLDVTEVERSDARELLANAGFTGGPLVTVCPAARWESKVYPAAHFASALDQLCAEAGVAQPVLVGSADMHMTCEAVANACKVAKPVNLCGRTNLRQLAAVLDIASLLVTCDSGPMHIAAAQKTPVLALLGPTDPQRTGPYGQLGNVMSGECELKPCLKRQCPGMGQKCLRELTPLSVAARAKKLLDEAMVGTRPQP